MYHVYVAYGIVCVLKCGVRACMSVCVCVGVWVCVCAYHLLNDAHKGSDEDEGARQTEREEVVLRGAQNHLVDLRLVRLLLRTERLRAS